VGGTGVSELVTGAFFCPAAAGSEVELMFARAPAAGADSDEVHDLVSLAGSGLAYHVHAVVSAGISLGLVQTVDGWLAGLGPVPSLGRVVLHGGSSRRLPGPSLTPAQLAPFVFAQPAPHASVLAGDKRPAQTVSYHLTAPTYQLGLLDLLQRRASGAEGKKSSVSRSWQAALARQSMMSSLERMGTRTASLVEACPGGHADPVWVGYMRAVYEPGRR
jgi:hypothetical protein